MININGTVYEKIEDLMLFLDSSTMSAYEKQCAINDFNGVINEPIINHVPLAVTARQMKKALALTNKYTVIENFISSLQEPQKTLVTIEWRESNEFQRTNTTLNQMATLMGMTKEEIDQLFIYASTL